MEYRLMNLMTSGWMSFRSYRKLTPFRSEVGPQSYSVAW